MRIAPLMSALILAACSTAPPPPAAKTEPPAPPPVKDLSSLLPATGRTAARVVPNHLLDQDKMPGGTLADYEAGKKKYQLFVVETANNEDAALLLIDMKHALKDPEYLPNFGGYFGSGGTRPVFVFAKLQYLAGVTGLSKEDADPIARILAARLK